MIIAALAAVAFMASTDAPAAAKAPSVNAQSAAAAGAVKLAEANPDQMVCVKSEQTGSRFPKTECRTRSEWRQLTQDSKDLLDDITTKHQMAAPFSGN